MRHSLIDTAAIQGRSAVNQKIGIDTLYKKNNSWSIKILAFFPLEKHNLYRTVHLPSPFPSSKQFIPVKAETAYLC